MLKNHTTTAQVAIYAEMCDFPCSKQELLQMAEEHEFPDEVIDVLEDLPSREYTCESALVEAAGDLVETESVQPEFDVEVKR
jgi:hypothetical protein